jgi:hypothetical protein
MKKQMRTGIALAAICLLPVLSLKAADTEPGKIDFGKFTPSPGAQFVEVNIKSNLISLVAKLVNNEPELKDTLTGLKEIKVNVLELNQSSKDEILQRMQAVRADLDTKGWDRVVTVQQEKNDVSISLKMNGDAVEGIVVTVFDGRQAVFVNVVGDIKPEKLALLGERFDIEPLKKLPMKKEHTRS